VYWWLSTVPMIPVQIGMMPAGPPAAEHWPGGKGYWSQPARFVEGVDVIRSEWLHAVSPAQPKRAPKPKAAQPPPRRRRR
jgi:hypothetical protein